MRRAYHRWYSSNLNRDIELLAFGHGGARMLAFPTSVGRFHDWEDRGMIAHLAGPIEAGQLQVFCVDSVDRESWYAYSRPAGERASRHEQYDRYLLDEVLPLTQADNPTPFLITAGASFGGYHAINFALKHPERVQRLLSMSGLGDIRRFVGNYYDQAVYFNNPMDFIANEQDPGRLEAMRRMDIILAVGRDDGLRDSNERLSARLWEKGIGNALRVWDGFAHDWPVWMQMLDRYLGGHD
jgi:esterase/lipase superfamily enzyme